ncbi:MAG: class I SAM-dependent methyltransferase [Acidimicrobiia bacterium]|nr:class I SAM-dependent methyltransferase [Acidimicrobiia bacterium]
MSWFQETPTRSLELIRRVTGTTASVIDVGGGASRLIDHLLEAGYRDLTVLDLAAGALEAARRRLGDRATTVTWIEGDVTTFDAGRRFDLWHDRAVLHFLTDEDDRRRYVDNLRRSLHPGGHVVLATFGPNGPEQCSGLPVRRYSVDDMATLLGEDFTLLDRDDEVHRTPTGADQAFVYGLFRFASGGRGS